MPSEPTDALQAAVDEVVSGWPKVPEATTAWLTEADNPAVATLARRLLGRDTPETDELWARRNEYGPVRRILEAQRDDGAWAPPQRDYDKYGGSLWQIVFLGELYADAADDRVRRAAEYAFSRQLPDGSWSCNGRPSESLACLTANVGRGLARLGFSSDERVVHALGYCADVYRTLGVLDCRGGRIYTVNDYCHMLAPKTLLFLGEVPRALWPDGADELRDAAVGVLRDKEGFRSLPAEVKEYQAVVLTTPGVRERREARARFLAEHQPLHYGDKAGWLRFGFPLSYNSDALEALLALAAVGEGRMSEYEPAIEAVEASADESMRWTMRTSLNGKMLADVEEKGRPSKWLTLRALTVLDAFSPGGASATSG